MRVPGYAWFMSTGHKTQSLGTAEFKAKCLELLEDVAASGNEYVVTKRGRPMARIVPIAPRARSSFGAWKERMEVVGDLVHADWSDEFEINAPLTVSRRSTRAKKR